MEFDQPDEDAYERVTNAQRYQLVVDAAKTLVDELITTFDLQAEADDPQIDFPGHHPALTQTIRLRPRAGVPLVFLFTDFPGVQIRFGDWRREAFPSCGCDACDEQPLDTIERMQQLVEAAVDGNYEEKLTKREVRSSFGGAWGAGSSVRHLEFDEWRNLGIPEAHTWPPWARREPAGSDAANVGPTRR